MFIIIKNQNQLQDGLKPMRKTRNSRHNRQKKFFEEEQHDHGTDKPNQFRYKIQSKQEDMFEPYQLGQNLFQVDQTEKQDEKEETAFKGTKEAEYIKDMRSRERESGSEGKCVVKRRQRRQKKKILESEEDQKEIQGIDIYKKKREDHNQHGQKYDGELLESGDRSSEAKDQERQQDISQLIKRKNRQKEGQVEQFTQIHRLVAQAQSKDCARHQIYAPLSQGQVAFVYFKRYSSGFNEYYQVLGEDERPILFCENQRGCIGSNYYISTTKEMLKNSEAYLGKLRGNATGSVYQLYDRGEQPKGPERNQNFRCNMACVEYEDNFMGMKGPRKLKVTLPKIQTPQDFSRYRFGQVGSLSQSPLSQVRRFRNKQPKWNDRLKSYALNFGGRVKQASIKNFILMEEVERKEDEEKERNVLIFGKVNETTFALEYRDPLSLYQAFGIAMSQFDYKLNCQ